ncbi:MULTISPECIES: lysophospholipid acyltransferase family protein [Olivibacter]|uniref:Lysophospholipid acyltransferase family protein n=1 Tax=Olivibacter oleidegradans TaxID=760123 RepID=A0ABV6HJE2_9SPHI|nr:MULTISPECIES: lysophospholipid acyltransferase family protein [Olivibacter]QEL01800.1 lysophospholipid acyltransferase family protein [Olivibacter sp. LS-1]
MNLGNRIVSFFVFIISLLPFWVLYCLSDFLFFILYYVVGYRKKVVYENLSNSFPSKSDEEIKQIAKNFFVFLSDMIIETIKMRTITAKEVEKRMVVHATHEIYRHLEQGKPVIGTTAHYSNWELGIHRLSLMLKDPLLIIYKPLSNKGFEQTFNNIRSRFNAQMVPMKQTLRQILAYENTPHMSMFLSDQTPARSESSFFTPFLGQDTLMFLGMEKIAKRTDFPVVYCHINRIRRGYYECTFSTLFETPKATDNHEITLAYNKYLEKLIHDKPEQWLWSHRRWKHKPSA